MENNIMRNLYDTMLDSGDLHIMMPEATGIWEKDKKEFKRMQEEMDEIISDSDHWNEISEEESSNLDNEF